MTRIYTTLSTLIDRLDTAAVAAADVIRWASPVPSFGDLSCARVATLGLNPSNREFVDQFGRELEGPTRRFHTLTSLGLNSWAEADLRHLQLIIDSCDAYFAGNPYDRWFRTLDQVVAAANASYYSAGGGAACHLDLIPYATAQKWTDLTGRQRTSLLMAAGDALALLLRDSAVQMLILNGQAVVDHFSAAFGASLQKYEMTDWTLSRASAKPVMGFAYKGHIDELAGVDLGHGIMILGFNHNLQSSYGVTTNVIQRIRHWVAEVVAGMQLNETP
jgi:hypothetical protein